jgi:hypothetical protein
LLAHTIISHRRFYVRMNGTLAQGWPTHPAHPIAHQHPQISGQNALNVSSNRIWAGFIFKIPCRGLSQCGCKNTTTPH